jgi:protoporphyrinogen oxidase
LNRRTAIIIGAGPAGLTAALELLRRTDIRPLVLEKSEYMGGIARTVNYKGNRIDIGGHRFFSKSDRVMQWWLDVLPLEKSDAESPSIGYQSKTREIAAAPDGPDPRSTDRVMLLRRRKSRIYYAGKFFDYPVRLSPRTLMNLGALRTLRIGAGYLQSMLFPIRPERNLEEFFINRFGRELYRTFFQSYTEKVWGVPCSKISAEWGAQRVKGLSIWKTLMHAVAELFQRTEDVAQKNKETSLIERFLYPKFGPGHMWEEVARRVLAQGGEIRTGWTATSVVADGGRVKGVHAESESRSREFFPADFVFSTAPIQEVIKGFQPPSPASVREIADGLVYRDFIMVGLLVSKLKVPSLPDNWIYIQDPQVQLGRLQVFNNWSPYMVADSEKVWLGLEYFCNQGDNLWQRSDAELLDLGRRELASIGMIDAADVLDGTVQRMEKTYPAYLGTYGRFGIVRDFVDQFENLFLIGRNGMHRYNNQDHSMLTAMTAVDNIVAGIRSKANLWEVNTEQDYHEHKRPHARSAARS